MADEYLCTIAQTFLDQFLGAEATQKAAKLAEQGQENKPLAKEFLDMGEEDLAASTLLYERGLYASSAYHLRQSVEKTSKCACYLLGITNTRRFGHRSLRGFFEMIREVGQAFGPDSLVAKVVPQAHSPTSVEESVTRAENGFKELEADPNWARANRDHLESHVSLIRTLRERVRACPINPLPGW